MASYWRAVRDCEQDKELVRAGLAYFAAILVGGEPDAVCKATDWTTSDKDWEYALKYRRLWVLVEEDGSPTTED